MNKILKLLDTLSYQPRFYSDGNTRFKTIWGGLVNILLVLLNLLGIIYFSKDIYMRTILLHAKGFECNIVWN